MNASEYHANLDDLFRALGTLILWNIIEKYYKKDLKLRVHFNGNMIKNKKYRFDLSLFTSDLLKPKLRKKIVQEFNSFLERN